MRNPLPVSARGLRGRAVRTYDRAIPAACLFPFFDRSGSVQSIMLLTPQSGQIHLLPWHAGLVRVPLWGPILLTRHWGSLRGIANEELERAGTLWHYDPWWMLDEAPWAAHPAVDLLKATNCANRLERKVTKVYYRRDLARLTWVTIDQGRGETARTRWQPDLLPAPEAPTAQPPAPERPAQPAAGRTPRSGPAWHFDPIWDRWTAR